MQQIICSFTSKQKQIYDLDYLSCPQKDHFSQDLSYICFAPQCSGKRIICSMCQQTIHKDHNATPIKDYLVKILHYQNNQKAISSLVYANQLQKHKLTCFNHLNNIKNTILDLIEEAKLQTETQFKKYEQKMMTFINFNQKNSSWIVSLQNVIQKNNLKRFNHIIQSITEVFPIVEQDNQDRVSSQQKLNLSKKLELILQFGQNQSHKFSWQIKNLQTKFIKQFPKSVAFQYTDLFKQKNHIQWDPILKGKGFKIEAKIITQTVSASDSQRFALTTEGYTSKLKKKVSWGFKINKLVGWVGIGVCLKNIMKSLNFKFNYTNIGHGSYLISGNGYSWSHSDKSSNSTYKSFSFSTNDTIYMEYDPLDKILRFKKAGGNSCYQLKIQQLSQGQELCPCVNLCSVNDCVQIVQVPANVVF